MKKILLIIALVYLAAVHWAQNGAPVKPSGHSYNPFSLRAQGMAMLLGVGGSPISYGTINVDYLYTGNYSTSGTAWTATIGNNSAVANNCTSGGGGSTGCNWQTPSGSGTWTVGANESGCSNLGPVAVNGGSTYAANTLTYNNIAFANASESYTELYLNYGISANAAVAGLCYYTPLTSNSQIIDLLWVEDSYGAASWVQLRNCTDGNLGFQFEVAVPGSGEGTGYCVEPTSSLFPGTFFVALYSNPGTNGLTVYGTQSSGGSATGSPGYWCNASFTGGQSGYLILSGTNSVSGAYVYGVATTGTPWSSAPTSATLSNGTGSMGATCSGTVTLTGATLGGLTVMSIHNSSTGALIGQISSSIAYHATPVVNQMYIGNDENYTGSTTSNFQNIFFIWTGTVPTDPFGVW